jgi:hypothetical protein
LSWWGQGLPCPRDAPHRGRSATPFLDCGGPLRGFRSRLQDSRDRNSTPLCLDAEVEFRRPRNMRTLKGSVSTGFGVAGKNLRHVLDLIVARAGLPRVEEGTLNIAINEPYIVPAEAIITALEYDGLEDIKLQRCRIRGLRAVIMRPSKHETVPGFGHGTSHIELLSHVHLRTRLKLHDGDEVEVEIEGESVWWKDD